MKENNTARKKEDETPEHIESAENILSEPIQIKSPEQIQKDKWVEADNTITTEIYDQQGSLIISHSTFEKIRDGKFKIALSTDDIKHPGLYKIKTKFGT